MTSTTTLKAHRISKTQIEVYASDRPDNRVTVTYAPGWNGGGNNYRSAKYAIHLAGETFATRTFPAGDRNTLPAVSPAVVTWLQEHFGIE